MRLVRPFLLSVSLLLFGWLFMSNVNLINVATTLNEAEINSEISKVNSYTDIDSLKEFTISQISYVEVIRKRLSENAMVRIAVIAALVVIQIILYLKKGNFSDAKMTK